VGGDLYEDGTFIVPLTDDLAIPVFDALLRGSK
jgi:hypothetical protein